MAVWRRHADITRHVQIGGVPGRHEPVGGTFDFPGFFAALDRSGYKGWVSAEYNPASLTAEGLGWLPQP